MSADRHRSSDAAAAGRGGGGCAIDLAKGEPPARVFEQHGPRLDPPPQLWASAFHYCEAQGYEPLRRLYADCEWGRLAPERVLVSEGVLGGLDLVLRCWRPHVERILVWPPTYREALTQLRDLGRPIVELPRASDGTPDVDALIQSSTTPDRDLLYLVASHNNPDGVTVSLSARYKLIDFAVDKGLRVVEDDAYGDLSFDGSVPASLRALADAAGQPHRVCRLFSLSKRLLPGLRIGLVEADSRHIARFANGKRTFGTSPVSSAIAAHLMADWEGVVRLRDAYRAHLRRSCAALCNGLAGTGLGFQWPSGGYFLWAKLPAGVSSPAFVARAAAAGIKVADGRPFWLHDRSDHIRLSFAYAEPAEIAEAAERLPALLREAANDEA